MHKEQTTIQAIIRRLDGTIAHVEVEHGGCGRCHEAGGCGGQHLTQMFCGGAKTYDVDNDIGAAVGDRVTIAVTAGNLRQSANLAYVLPLAATIAGAVLGTALGNDLTAVLGAGIGLALAFLVVAIRSRRPLGNLNERPHIISRS